MRIIFIRHPKPVIEAGICYGQTDMPADAIDLERVVGNLLQMPRPLAVLSSPLIRAHHLALAMHQQAQWPVPILDSDLKEMHFGDWESRSWKHIPREEVNAWAADVLNYAPPGGESVQQLALRSANAVKRFVETKVVNRTTGDFITVFCHAGVLQTAPVLLQGKQLDPADGMKLKYDYGDTVEIFLS